MDIRKFFTPGGLKISQSSATKTSQPGSTKISQQPAKKPIPKPEASDEDSPIKKKPKRAPLPRPVRGSSDDSDFEIPVLPVKTKRRTVVSSDSSANPSPIKSPIKESKKKISSSPSDRENRPTSSKNPTKRAQKMTISSDDEASPVKSPAKKTKAIEFGKVKESVKRKRAISSDEEEEAFVEEKPKKSSPKKALFVPKKAMVESPKKASKVEEMKKVSPMDFFGGFESTKKPSTSKPKTPVKKTEEVKPKKTPVKNEEKKIEDSPSKSQKSKKKEDEESMEVDEEVVTKTPSPKKSKPTKDAEKSLSVVPETPEATMPVKPKKPVVESPKSSAEKSKKTFEKPKASSEKPAKASQEKSSQASPSKTPKAPPKASPKKYEKLTLEKEGLTVLRHPKEVNKTELPWVDKHKPTDLKQLIGQLTPASPMNKLLGWLKDWAKHNLGPGALEKKPKPSPFEAQRDGKAFKTALLSGPPGVGKTTSAVMACKQLGLNFVEMNASDSRNKKILDNRLMELLGSRQMDQFYAAQKVETKPNTVTHVLIMDEVDGMSGNQDRGGMAELIQMIKMTRIPIICICNDRQSPKIRSLANHCFDLRFQRPRLEQIKGRLKTIAFQEKIKITDDQLEKIIQSANQDIRQCIYSLQMLSTGSKDLTQKKDVSVNIFEAARQILSADTTLMQKQEMFFTDYSIMPLFVQENYPNVRGPRMSQLEQLKAMRRASESIAFGDIIDKRIRSTGHWNLLTSQAMFSCALPCLYLDGYMTDQISFPSWLGKNSTAQKRQRLMRQLSTHAHLKISGSNHALVCDYIPVLRDRMYRPLVRKETEGVKEVVEVYVNYALTKDDTEAINELGVWPGAKDVAQNVSTKAKSALTRALNKEHRLLPYAQLDMAKGKKKAAMVADLEIDEEGHMIEKKLGGEDENEEDEDEEIDDLPGVVVQKPSAKAGGPSKPGGSRGGRGGGRGGGTPRDGRGGRGRGK